MLPLYPSPSGELWTERALRSIVLWSMGSTLSTFLGGSTVSEHGRKPRTLSLTCVWLVLPWLKQSWRC